MPKRISINAARQVGEENGCKQIILLAFDGKLTHIVTWGKTTEDCEQAAHGGNLLKQKWGWPECNDQPSRVKAMLAKIKAQKKALEAILEWYDVDSTEQKREAAIALARVALG